MILQHSAVYLIARIVQSAVIFLAVALYTRLLTPAEYGNYAIVLAGVTLANALIGQWLYSTALRLVTGAVDQSVFLSTVAVLYGIILAAAVIAGLAACSLLNG